MMRKLRFAHENEVSILELDRLDATTLAKQFINSSGVSVKQKQH